MPDVPEPTEAEGGRAKKVTLSVKEQKLIEAYRAKTEGDRQFNNGIDHALECLNTWWNSKGSSEVDNAAVDHLRQMIGRALRDV
jgi:hypothetical protein